MSEAVSPGGPAAEAGIKPGDIITGVADLDLTKDSNPGRALVEKMNQLGAGPEAESGRAARWQETELRHHPRAAPRDVLMRQWNARYWATAGWWSRGEAWPAR